MSPHPGPYLEVAVAAPLWQPLTYLPPADGRQPAPGQRLLVPLGNRLVTGFLLGFRDRPETGMKLKPVAEVLDQGPLFPENLLPFFQWIAQYYQHPIGEVITTALPAGLSRRSTRRLRLTPAGRSRLAEEGDPAFAWLPTLLAKGKLGPAATRKLWQGRARKRLEEWQRRGWLIIEEAVSRDKVRPRMETWLAAVSDLQRLLQAEDLKPSERKTLELLAEITAGTPTPLPRRTLTSRYPGAGKAIRSLVARGWLRLEQRRLLRDPFGRKPLCFPAPSRLTAEQQAALDQLLPAVRSRSFTPFLLRGVTGSGKTEVYLQAAAATLALGRGVLVLVPEIALATQVEGQFFSRFGDQLALLHSGLSAAERFDQWGRLLSGEARIAIGARSAVFAPLADPGLIIVDEEHDSAYKQEDGLRYNARDLAVLRARFNQATVLLGSATPDLTSFHHARQKKYQLLELNRRVEDRPLPTVELIDLKGIKTVSGRPPLFSPTLIRAIKDNLTAGNQTLIFLNRRGFASLMLCSDCGQPVQCRHCQVSLTLHQGRSELLCHYCGYTAPSRLACPHCRSGRLTAVGFGTERLEAELKNRFPQAAVARLDRDTAQDRKAYLATLREVHAGKIDILIGTQMITKGHHFPKVTLVGIVWADAGLGIPDFKAAERTFQLLSQVTGRAGRGEQPGRVIVQTCQPDHYSVALAQAHDYHGFYARETALRQEVRFPPFARLINLRLEGSDEDQVRRLAQALAGRARSHARGTIEVLGPAPAVLAKLRGKHRWQLLLKGASVPALHGLCQGLCREYPSLPGAHAVKLSLDVDPENML